MEKIPIWLIFFKWVGSTTNWLRVVQNKNSNNSSQAIGFFVFQKEPGSLGFLACTPLRIVGFLTFAWDVKVQCFGSLLWKRRYCIQWLDYDRSLGVSMLRVGVLPWKCPPQKRGTLLKFNGKTPLNISRAPAPKGSRIVFQQINSQGRTVNFREGMF